MSTRSLLWARFANARLVALVALVALLSPNCTVTIDGVPVGGAGSTAEGSGSGAGPLGGAGAGVSGGGSGGTAGFTQGGAAAMSGVAGAALGGSGTLDGQAGAMAGGSASGAAAGMSAMPGAGFGGAAAGSAGSAGSAGAGMGGAGTGPPFAEVSAIITTSCATPTCHGGRETPDMRTNLYSVLTTTAVRQCGGDRLVAASDTTNSALIELVSAQCGTFVMPEDCAQAPCIDPQALATLTAWIQAGAPP